MTADMRLLSIKGCTNLANDHILNFQITLKSEGSGETLELPEVGVKNSKLPDTAECETLTFGEDERITEM